MPKQFSRRAEFWAGVKDTFPLVVGAVPFGIIFGVIAVTTHLIPVGAMSMNPLAYPGSAALIFGNVGMTSYLPSAGAAAMSLFVFAGSSQFIAAGLLAGGTSAALIIVTTFVVNLRHALYSASLAPYMKHLPQRWLIPLSFWLTDESFVVVIARYTQPDASPYKHWYFLGSALFMYINWNICTLIGVVAGQSVKGVQNLGLDFAMIVTFIGMLVPLIRSRAVMVCVMVSGLTALLTNGFQNKIGLIIAALLGVVAGVVADSLFPQMTTAETTPVETGTVSTAEPASR